MPTAIFEDIPVSYHIEGSGPPLLMLAGTGYSGSTWHPKYLDAVRAAATVITFDYPGTGNTPGADIPYTTRWFAAAAYAVLSDAGLGPAHLVGHSMGGRVAQWLGLDHPESVRSIVLAASGAGANGPSVFNRVGIPIPLTLDLTMHGYGRDFYHRAQRRSFFTPEFATAQPDEVDWLTDACWASAPTLPDYLKHVVARQAHTTVNALPALRVPCYILVGSRDTHEGGTGSHVAEAAELRRLLPHSESHTLPGLRHGLFWEAPADIAALLNGWVRRIS